MDRVDGTESAQHPEGRSVNRARPVLAVRGLTKHYGALVALDGVNVECFAGEVLGLVGDNGAGKSTFVKLVSGAVTPTAGHVFVDDEKVELRTPHAARALGIETIYQDLALAENIRVYENLFLGREQVKRGLLGRVGWLDKRFMRAEADRQLGRLGIEIGSTNVPCSDLSGGQRQAIAVARSIMHEGRIVLMDEPTAALGVEEQDRVAALVTTLRRAGTPVLLISHNMPLVHELCDRVIVLRHGEVVAELDRSESTVENLVLYITGGRRKVVEPSDLPDRSVNHAG